VRIQAIDHVTLRVRSVALAKEYYEAVFGLKCSPATVDGATVLRLENLDAAHVRAQHLSFTVADLDAVISELEARGEQCEVGRFEGFTYRNYRWCEWRDPEGIRVECVEPLVSDGSSDG
jgi:catechol 2,3-dioxygenase-like lactoylglutathione lyase family enzyme